MNCHQMMISPEFLYFMEKNFRLFLSFFAIFVFDTEKEKINIKYDVELKYNVGKGTFCRKR